MTSSDHNNINQTMWNQEFTSQLWHPEFARLDNAFAISALLRWPNADGLNKLKQSYGLSCIPKFVCQSILGELTDYYENIIHHQQVIPTRPDSWHDLFNGLIWLQFPESKKLLNRLHVEDITKYGIHPRTPKRNRITHFDECGVVVICSDQILLNKLAKHEWYDAFQGMQKQLGKSLHIRIFGHATLESLLNPFIGLTSKWTALSCPDEFALWSNSQQNAWIDHALHIKISKGEMFEQKSQLKPLPILGIPSWYDGEQCAEFYANTDYFRPTSLKK